MNASISIKPVVSSRHGLSSTQIIVSGLRAAQDEAHRAAYEAGYQSFFSCDENMPAEFVCSPLASSWLAGREEAQADDLEMFETSAEALKMPTCREQVASFV